ncbi:hypothetical protein WA158_007290 [Blastocystis sp. Blastoise]
MSQVGGKKRFYEENASSNNELIHKDNLYYNNSPDFKLLAKEFPSFAHYIQNNDDGTSYIDWKDPYASLELTKVLLKKDFDLDWEIPIDRLCPGITGRINYLNWIHDLLNYSKKMDNEIKGIDIGIGASCIYPLLGNKIYTWNFLGSDIDDISIQYAKENVKRNHLENFIQIVKQENSDCIFKNILENNKEIHYDFSMCNPPFFIHQDEACTNPSTCCMGTSNELITKGGEEQFIVRYIDESILYKDQIDWFTCLIGKKKTLKTILKYLQTKEIKNICSTTFYQGKTSRWGIAWSFTTLGYNELQLNSKNNAIFNSKRIKKQKSEVTFEISSIEEDDLLLRIHDFFNRMNIEDISYTIDMNANIINCTLYSFMHYEHSFDPSEPIPLTSISDISIPNNQEPLFKAQITIEENNSNKNFTIMIDIDPESKDRPTFFKFCETFQLFILRNNRKWRRYLNKK